MRAFVFGRSGKTYVVFWHPSGKANLEIDVDPGRVHLFRELDRELPIAKTAGGVMIPYGDRQYLLVDLSKQEVLSHLRSARALAAKK